MKPILQLEQCFSSTNQVPPEVFVNLLEEINQADSPGKDTTDQQIIDLIVAGTINFPIQHKAFSPFCHFIFKQCTKQIRLSSFRASSFEKCITYLLNGLESNQCTAELRVDILRALSALLYENSTNTSKFYSSLIPLLLQSAERSVKPLEIRRMAINCLGNLCAGAGSKLQLYYKDIYKVLLSNLCVVSHTNKGKMMVASPSSLDFNDPAIRKVASSTLRALQFLLGQDKTLVTNPLCDIVEIIHTFLFMHVNVQSYQLLLALSSSKEMNNTGSRMQSNRICRSSSILTSSSHHHHLQQQQPTWRPHTNRYLSNGITSSDSELSDSDSVAFSPRKCRDDAKIRINAVLCLLAVAKTQPRALYPNWQKFIPDSFSLFLKNHALVSPSSTTNLASQVIYPLSPNLRSDQQSDSLLTLLLYDPMVTVRVAVCHTLIAMLDGSKQYLSVASERDTKSSFTSLSERLASILHDLHLGLVYALVNESESEVVCLIMKVMSMLMTNTSYNRLSPGYLSQFYKVILSHWKLNISNKGKDDTELRQQIVKTDVGEDIHVIILRTLATMVTATGATNEIRTLLTGVHQEDSEEEVNPLLPFLLSLVDSMNSNVISLDIQMEAWRALSSCAKHHLGDIMFGVWDSLASSFEMAFSHPKLRTVTLEFVEAYASAMISFCSEENNVSVEDLSKCTTWWMKILEKYIQQASIDTTPNIRVLACDCLATMAKAVFENFPVRYQRLAIALLLPLPDDEESQVRAAACRALGAFVLFPTLRQDTCFVSDMATVLLDRMEDQVILVRLRASWAQGNLCDALVIASDADGFDLREWISIPTWMKMTSTATSASLDNDKLRSNAVRAIGSLLRITPLNYFQDRHGMLLVRDALTGLVKNIESGSLKTRWNACHAASNALKNRHFPIGYRQQYDQGGEMYKKEDQQEYPWTRIVFQTLTNALQCKNYKVRINACLALATPHQRSFYGHHLVPIYHALMSAWSICHDPNATTEYQEYKYQDQLKTQLKDALLHIHDWLPPEDQITIDTLLLET